MNEAETRAEYIDPMLLDAQWGHNLTPESQVLREHYFSDGQILAANQRGKRKFADYILSYKNQKLAIIEAKKISEEVTEGLEQVKEYARLLNIRLIYTTNGRGIYRFDMESGRGDFVEKYPSPIELYRMTHGADVDIVERALAEPLYREKFTPRYYQESAIQIAVKAIAEGHPRALLTLATGTGKTFIAFQIVWKIFHARWNRRGDGRRPRVLFLADRNVLIEQAMGDFNPLENDIVRVNGEEIRKRGGNIPTNAHIFFSIYQAMVGGGDKPYFLDYPKDFFDLIIIDECHRGGASDASNWRAVLDHFTEATHLGLTATPKRTDNVDTYEYFGDPLYTYSLREGIEDGFLTPFKVKKISTTLDQYTYGPGDVVLEGELEKDEYSREEMNRVIVIPEREEALVKIMLQEIDQSQKTIVFCMNEAHALMTRDFINKHKESNDPDYCVRVTASEGAVGDQWLRVFRDNDKTIPTTLTTSQKLSTGVDARNLRFVVLMRPVGSMVEFKQIVGRGTRTYEGKNFFTIVDFYDNWKKFNDPEWDGAPVEIVEPEPKEPSTTEPKKPKESGDGESPIEPPVKKERIKVQLSPHRAVFMDHMVETLYFDSDGKAVSPEQFLKDLFLRLPEFFADEGKLREIWSDEETRKNLLSAMAGRGFELEKIKLLQEAFSASDADVYDFLRFVAFDKELISRKIRVEKSDFSFSENLDEKNRQFVDFVLSQYEERGFEEFDDIKTLIEIRFGNVMIVQEMGGAQVVSNNFQQVQKELYRA